MSGEVVPGLHPVPATNTALDFLRVAGPGFDFQPIAPEPSRTRLSVGRFHFQHISPTEVEDLFAGDMFPGANMGIALPGFGNMVGDPEWPLLHGILNAVFGMVRRSVDRHRAVGIDMDSNPRASVWIRVGLLMAASIER